MTPCPPAGSPGRRPGAHRARSPRDRIPRGRGGPRVRSSEAPKVPGMRWAWVVERGCRQRAGGATRGAGNEPDGRAAGDPYSCPDPTTTSVRPAGARRPHHGPTPRIPASPASISPRLRSRSNRTTGVVSVDASIGGTIRTLRQRARYRHRGIATDRLRRLLLTAGRAGRRPARDPEVDPALEAGRGR